MPRCPRPIPAIFSRADCLRQVRPCLFSYSRFPFSRSLTGLAVSGHHPFPDGLTVPGHAGYCLPCPAVFLPAATFHAVPFRASAPPRPFRASTLPCPSPFEPLPRSFRACKHSCRTLGLQRRIFPILPILFRIRKTMFGGNSPGEPLDGDGFTEPLGGRGWRDERPASGRASLRLFLHEARRDLLPCAA